MRRLVRSLNGQFAGPCLAVDSGFYWTETRPRALVSSGLRVMTTRDLDFIIDVMIHHYLSIDRVSPVAYLLNYVDGHHSHSFAVQSPTSCDLSKKYALQLLEACHMVTVTILGHVGTKSKLGPGSSAATAFPALTTKRRKQLFLANPLGGGVGGFGSALGGGSTVVDGSFGGGAFLVEGVMVVYVFLSERDE
ncbi:hypothetical protein Tco_0421566 [Tanacetum coccineum]